jgi:HAD superfamily hydrolase (TIGR01509 family)
VTDIGFDVRPMLAAHGLEDAFDEVVQSYEVGIQKPGPGIFDLACATLGVAPGRTLTVGDTPADAGAAGAGLRVLLLPVSPRAGHGLEAVRQLR